LCSRLALSPDGKILVAQGSLVGGNPTASTIRSWDLAQGKAIGPALYPHAGTVFSFCWRRDSKAVLTASWDRTVRRCDPSTGKPRPPALPHHDVVQTAIFSPDEKSILTASQDATARLWDTATGEPLSPYLRHPDGILWVGFSPDGQTILTASNDRTLR